MFLNSLKSYQHRYQHYNQTKVTKIKIRPETKIFLRGGILASLKLVYCSFQGPLQNLEPHNGRLTDMAFLEVNCIFSGSAWKEQIRQFTWPCLDFKTDKRWHFKTELLRKCSSKTKLSIQSIRNLNFSFFYPCLF